MFLRAVLYTRVSTEDQADYGTGLETQQIEGARFAERIGAVVVAVESDPGVSGTIYPRPGIERAIKLLESGQADALIVHRVDRLGREHWIPPYIYKQIKVAQARLFTVEDGEVTDENILLFSLRCGMAQTDYNRIIKNMKAGKRRMAEKGQTPSRAWSPYGYHIVQKIEEGQVRADAGAYVIVEAEAEIIRLIYARYEAGDGLSAICRLLHTQGIQIPRPDRASLDRSCWQATMIARILKQTAYKGYVVWGKTSTTIKDKATLPLDERLNCRNEEGRKRIITPTPEAMQVRIPVPPIVSVELWETCQQRREENKAVSGIRNDRKHLFASLVRCPGCGRRMNSGRVNYKAREPKDRPIMYRCRDHAQSQNSAGIVCHRKPYREDDIRQAVRHFFAAIVDMPEFVTAAFQAYQQARKSDYSQEEHMEVIKSMRELDAREAATAEGYTRPIQLGTRKEVFEKLLTDIATERKHLEARKAAMEAQLIQDKDDDPKEVAQIVAEYARDILEVLDSETLTSIEKNTALRRVVQEIRPADDGFCIASRPLLQGKEGHQVDIHEAPVTGIVTPVK